MPRSSIERGGGKRLAERLAGARQRLFVGRHAELELFRGALASEEPPFNLLVIQGPGGVGKTALLAQYARLAAEAGRPVVSLDGHDIQASPHGFTVALAQALGLPEGADPLEALCARDRLVLLVDTFEALASLQDWLRTRLLPALPANSVTVLAGRHALADEWRNDLGWAELSRVIALRNLRPEESCALLVEQGIPAERHDEILRLTHGHPLALWLVAETVRAGVPPGDLPAAGLEPLQPLLRHFVAGAPSPLHRQAVEAASVAYRTTQPTLAAALRLGADDETVYELFQWLRELPVMEQGPQGLFPHDIVRDVLFDDLRFRDPERLQRLSRRLASSEGSRFLRSQGREQHAAFWGLMYVRRHQPSAARFFDWNAMGQAFAEPAKPEDGAGILAMVETHEGAASAGVAGHWFQLQPGAFSVFRSLGGELEGFACHLLLDLAAVTDAFDPALAAIRQHVDRHGRLRDGELVSVHRYWMAHTDYQSATAHNTTAPGAVAQWMSTPGLAWSFVVLRDVDSWAPFFAYLGFHHAERAAFSLGPGRYGCVAHDWRAEPPAVWWEAVGQRYNEGLQAPAVLQRPTASVLVLSQPEFGDAVRRAYRDYGRRDALAANPLARSRLVRQVESAVDAGEALQALLREAVTSLQGHPRDRKLYRALWHTYIEPAPTQEAAAELLDLPFSTYRRHLRAGLDRVTEWLWRRELHGP